MQIDLTPDKRAIEAHWDDESSKVRLELKVENGIVYPAHEGKRLDPEAAAKVITKPFFFS
jgi:hypothetical protein